MNSVLCNCRNPQKIRGGYKADRGAPKAYRIQRTRRAHSAQLRGATAHVGAHEAKTRGAHGRHMVDTCHMAATAYTGRAHAGPKRAHGTHGGKGLTNGRHMADKLRGRGQSGLKADAGGHKADTWRTPRTWPGHIAVSFVT